MPFVCSICDEASSHICARCTKDVCGNHLCEKCLRCSDCCECEVTLEAAVHESAHATAPDSAMQAAPDAGSEPLAEADSRPVTS